MALRSPLFILSGIAAIACAAVAVLLGGNSTLVTPLLDRFSASGGMDSNYVYMLSALPNMTWLFGALAIAFAIIALLPSRIWRGVVTWGASLPLRQVVITVSLVSLGINLILIATIPYQLWDDYEIYHRMAIDLLQGRGVQQGWLESGSPSAFWPVGYPAFLALFYGVFGANMWVGQLVNAVLRLITIVVTGRLARHFWGENVAKVAVIIMGFFPSLLFHTLTIGYNLTLITGYVLLAYLVLTMKGFTWKRTLLIGVVLAALVYVRPTFLFVPVLIAVLWAIQGRAIRPLLMHSAVVAVTMGIVIAPWLWRGYQLFGEWVPMYTNGGVNLFIGNNPEATGGYYSAPAFAHTEVTPMNEAERDHYFRGLATAWIRDNPVTFAKNAVKKALLIVVRDDQGVSFATKQRYAERPAALLLAFVLISNLYYDAVVVLAVGYAVYTLWTRQRRRDLLLLGLLVAYVVGIYMLFFGMDHYKVPFLFVPVLLAAQASCNLIRRVAFLPIAPSFSVSQERSGEPLL